MSEKDTEPVIDKKIEVVNSWIEGFAEGVVGEIDQSVLRDVLAAHGANFENKEALSPLSAYTNKDKAPSLRAVWGVRFDEFKDWSEEWADDYEAQGKKLPRLGKKPEPGESDTRTRTSGPKQFFGELTAFAAGKISFERYKYITQIRIENGKLWEEGKGKERTKILMPDNKYKRPSSIAPSFPASAWEKIKSWS